MPRNGLINKYNRNTAADCKEKSKGEKRKWNMMKWK